MEAIKEVLGFPAYFFIKLAALIGPSTKFYVVKFFGWFNGYMYYIFGLLFYGALLFGGAESTKKIRGSSDDDEVE